MTIFDNGGFKIGLFSDADLAFLSIDPSALNTADWNKSRIDDEGYYRFERSSGPSSKRCYRLNGDEIIDPLEKEIYLCCLELVNDVSGVIKGKPFAEYFDMSSLVSPDTFNDYIDCGFFLVWRDYDNDVTHVECRIRTFDTLPPNWKPLKLKT